MLIALGVPVGGAGEQTAVSFLEINMLASQPSAPGLSTPPCVPTSTSQAASSLSPDVGSR